jgi:hypothetical protein
VQAVPHHLQVKDLLVVLATLTTLLHLPQVAVVVQAL